MTALRNILFLCTGNSARSILAEAITNRIGGGRVRAFSAGSRPVGRVNPHALELLIDLGYPTADLRSKGFDDFTSLSAPRMDIVITLCDEAAGESCPVWPGHPLTAHWGIPDPTTAGNAKAIRSALADAYQVIEGRVTRLLVLPYEDIDPAVLRRRLADIGGDRTIIAALTP